tara:strand:- start:231 stop:638 length:408 start_codon:yes stop_codon:yes gene_type:complete
MKKPSLLATISEKQIESEILRYLNTITNCFAFKINTGGIFDPKTKRFRKIVNPHLYKGTSDIICCYEGGLIAFEVKKPKPNKTYASKDQKLFLDKIESAKGAGYVVRSVAEVTKIMEEKCLNHLKKSELCQKVIK